MTINIWYFQLKTTTISKGCLARISIENCQIYTDFLENLYLYKCTYACMYIYVRTYMWIYVLCVILTDNDRVKFYSVPFHLRYKA